MSLPVFSFWQLPSCTVHPYLVGFDVCIVYLNVIFVSDSERTNVRDGDEKL